MADDVARRSVEETLIDDVVCSFCGKNYRLVTHMIAGEGVYICDECVPLCVAILTEVASKSEFRVAMRRADGTVVEIEGDLAPERKDDFAAGFCHRCGTWLVGYDMTDCFHCGMPLGKQRGADGTA